MHAKYKFTACSSTISFSVINYTQASDKLVKNELSLIEIKVIYEAYLYLDQNKRKKSIIYKAIVGVIKNKSLNREDSEDILSEALYLLRKALKYFETDRLFNFNAYAITFIRESIKQYRSK